MGPVRLGVGTEWLLDGRAWRVVRQLAPDRFIAQDVKFLVEQEFSQEELLAHYSAGRLRFASDEAQAPQRKPAPAKPAPIQELTAQQRFVRLGERRGDLVAVVSGLKAGETVVSSGAFKLRSGAAVVIKNDMAPDVQANPKPAEN